MSAEQLASWTAIIGAVASLLWPLIVIVALVVFRSPVMRTLGKVSEAGGAIEVFGVKVNVGKATEQQQTLIEDLQTQVREIQKQLATKSKTAMFEPPPAKADVWGEPLTGAAGQDWAAPVFSSSIEIAAPARRPAPRVLWVDDVPDNNLLLVASLRNRSFLIDQVLSTDAALVSFGPSKFDAIVSDMGRGADSTAGLQLTVALRKRDKSVPILIFCSKSGATAFRQQAMDAGATVITDSATLIMQTLLDLQSPQ